MIASPAAHQLCRILSFDPQDRVGLDLTAPGDWPKLLSLARQQSLAPLLYHRIQILGLCDAVPTEVLANLHNEYLHSAAGGMRIDRQFDAILEGLDSAHLPVIPLKGIYLMQVVYQNPALRPMSDIDILLRMQDIAPAVEVLSSLGYQPTRPFDLRTESKFHRHLPAFFRPNSYEVEVHTSLQEPSDPFDIDLAALWLRAGETQLGNRTVACLDPHDLLLCLCIHVAFHDLFFLGLRGIYDIGAVIDHFQTALDWDELCKRSIEWRAGNLVYITLSLAHELIGANIPSEFLTHLTPPHFDEALFSICKDLIFASPSIAAQPVTPALEQLVRVANPLVKFRILLNRLFIPRTEISYYYNVSPGSWKIFWCYPQRLKYLVERYFSIGLHLSTNDPYLVAVSDEVRVQEHQHRQLMDNLI